MQNTKTCGPDDGSIEPKRYRVDLSIFDRCNQFFYILLDYNPLFTFHIYIYIYIYTHQIISKR